MVRRRASALTPTSSTQRRASRLEPARPENTSPAAANRDTLMARHLGDERKGQRMYDDTRAQRPLGSLIHRLPFGIETHRTTAGFHVD